MYWRSLWVIQFDIACDFEGVNGETASIGFYVGCFYRIVESALNSLCSAL
jgi:hypothetical protein